MSFNRADRVHRDRVAGLAALYLAAALVAAMPYFLLVVDYLGLTTAPAKVASIIDHYSSMYAMYLVTYVFFGVVLAVLTLRLSDQLGRGTDPLARVARFLGLAWAVALILSGLVFTFGMTTVVSLAEESPDRAAAVWPAIESVAQGLGGAGGETLGGLWLLTLSWTAVRARALPTALGWFGLITGAVGLASTLPALNAAVVAFGLLQIIWFAWVGVLLLTAPTSPPRQATELQVESGPQQVSLSA